jgi:polar amino acid transport system substrate-binding protein
MSRLQDTRRPRSSAAIAGRPLRYLCAVVALTFGLSGCGSDSGGAPSAALDPQVVRAGTLTVCTSFPYAPFEFRRGGEPAGFDIDLAEALAKELQLKPEFVNGDFDKIESGQLLNDGTCDIAIAGISIRGERARVLDFSSPYFDAGQAMVVEKGSDVSSLEDLGGARIGVQSATTGELYVTDHAPADATIVPLSDASDVTDALRDGDVDAGIYDNTVVGSVVSRNPRFEVAAEFATGEQYGIAVKKNGSVDLLRFINNVLAELRTNGGYDEIYNRWFGSSATQ